jgi:hypothetical protein
MSRVKRRHKFWLARMAALGGKAESRNQSLGSRRGALELSCSLRLRVLIDKPGSLALP